MKTGFACALVVLVASIATPAAAQKVYVDFDNEAPFGSYETYSWMPTSETSLADTAPLIHDRLVEMVEAAISEGGTMTKDDENPDVWITYHTETKDEMRLSTDQYGYSYGPGWGWDPYWNRGVGMTSTTSYSYTKGTLIIDIIDAKSKKLVFRGTSTAIVPEKPEKLTRQMEKVVKKMGKEFDKKTKRAKKASLDID